MRKAGTTLGYRSVTVMVAFSLRGSRQVIEPRATAMHAQPGPEMQRLNFLVGDGRWDGEY